MTKKKKYDKLGNRKIVYTVHVLKRMSKRGVDKRTVFETLKHPQIALPKLEDNTQEFRRKVGERTHYVVVEHKRGNLIVVTTGWSKEE